MTRGKYAKRAGNNRDRESLVSEAESAKRAAARLESDTAKTVHALESRVACLTEDLAAARRLMDENASPVVVQLRGQLQDAREKIDGLRKDLRTLRTMFGRFKSRLALVLARNFGLPAAECASLVSETISLTTGSADEHRRIFLLLDGPDKRDSHAVRAVEKGRMTPAQADTIAAKHNRFPVTRRADRKGSVHDTFGSMWSAEDDEFGLYLVARDASTSPSVVAIYDNGPAAERHAETDPELTVLKWQHLSEYTPGSSTE